MASPESAKKQQSRTSLQKKAGRKKAGRKKAGRKKAGRKKEKKQGPVKKQRQNIFATVLPTTRSRLINWQRDYKEYEHEGTKKSITQGELVDLCVEIAHTVGLDLKQYDDFQTIRRTTLDDLKTKLK